MFATNACETASWKKCLSNLCAAFTLTSSHFSSTSNNAVRGCKSTTVSDQNETGSLETKSGGDMINRAVRKSLANKSETLKGLGIEKKAHEANINAPKKILYEKALYLLSKIDSNNIHDEQNKSIRDVDEEISVRNLENLIRFLEPTFHPQRTIALLYGNRSSRYISLNDFIVKWKELTAELNMSDNKRTTLNDKEWKTYMLNMIQSRKSMQSLENALVLPNDLGFKFKDIMVNECAGLSNNEAIHLVLTSLGRPKKIKEAKILQLKIPSLEKIEVSYPYTKEEDEGWNECYHRHIDLVRRSVDELTQEIDPWNENVLKQAIDSHFSMFALRGDFNSRAMGTAKLIVDEFALPQSLKTICPLKSIDDNDELMYEVNGIVLRLVNIKSRGRPVFFHDRDRLSLDCGVQASIFSTNNVRRYSVAHEMSCMNWIDKIVCSYDMKSSSTFDLRQPLSTVIDYAGYRFIAYAYMSVTSEDTLVHGFSHTEGLFVNNMDEVDDFVPYLAQQLGLSGVLRLLPCREANYRDDTHRESSVTYKFSNTLAKNLQFHAVDNRIYVINTANIRPPVVSRKGTYDPYERKIRPEIFDHSRLPSYEWHFISPQILTDGDSVSVDIAQSFVNLKRQLNEVSSASALLNLYASKMNVVCATFDKKLSHALLEEAIKPSSVLYAKLIPETALILDSMVVVPVDSHSLITFLHSQGINIHHLGYLYSICKLPHIKQLLLCEMVARASKSYLIGLLHDVGNNAISLSLLAQMRSKSNEEDFLEHQNRTLDLTSTTIIDFYNTLLGHQGPKGTHSTNIMWCEVLPRLLFKKFALDISAFDQHEISHLNQLFIALQYNTHVIFRRRMDYGFGQSIKPFSAEGFIDYVESSKCVGPNFYRPLDDSNEAVDTLMANGMYTEAMNILRMKLSAFSLLYSSDYSARVTSARNDLIHKIILCKYFTGDYQGCINAIKSSLSSEPIATIASAKLNVLAMCVNYQLNDLGKALRYFELARIEYTIVLGVDHPVLVILFGTLADLYYDDMRLQEAKVMLIVSHSICCYVLGEFHIVTIGYALKLSNVLINQGIFDDAAMLNLNAYKILENFSDVFIEDIRECLCGLVICQWRTCKFIDAERTCALLLEVCKGDKTQKVDSILYSILMADILTMSGRSDDSCNCLEDAWVVLKRGEGNCSYGGIPRLIASRVFAQMFVNLALVEQHALLIFNNEFATKYASDVDENMRKEIKDLLWTLGPSNFFDAMLYRIEWYKERKLSENVVTFNHNEMVDILEAGCQVLLFLNLCEPLDMMNEDGENIKANADFVEIVKSVE